MPLLLVDTRTAIPAATVETLSDLGIRKVRIVGDINAVPSANAGQLVDAGFTVRRLGGADRYATSAIVTMSAFDAAPNGAYLASGTSFPDALAGSAVAGAQGSPLLISASTCVPQRILDELERLQPASVTLLGGEPSLSMDVARLSACS
jgi:5'-nucleotidase